MIMKNILLSTLFALITTLGFSQAPNYVPANGLVGWWPFNGNADDESGNGNNGSNNGATLTTDRNGVVDKAYSFDGIDDKIIITAQTSIPQQSNYTASLWFKSAISDYNGAFISFGTWFCKLGHDSPGFFYKDEIGNSSNNWYEQAHFGVQPTVNTWNNLILKKINNTVTLILNNSIIGSMTTYGFSNFNPSSLIQFGYYCCQNYFAGSIDDIGIWNRALTECEIQNLYTSSIPTNTITTASACDSYLWNGQTYTASGVYTEPTANCVTESLNLTITPSSTNTTSASACDSYSWNGQTYSTSGVYTGTTTNCVTESLNLTITPSSTNTTTAAACDSYTWNGQTYTSSGIYAGNTANCVTESLNLTITPSSTITQPASQSTNISNNAQFIVGSSGSNAIYQWQTNLGFGFQNLNNAGQYNGTTSSTLSVLNLSMSNNNQVFRCIISSGSCTDTSAVAVLTVVNNAGINNINASKLSIYPNPTNGDFTITGLELLGSVSSLSLTDMNGKVVKVLDTKATKFSMASIKPGVYFLNIRADNKQEVLKIVKE